MIEKLGTFLPKVEAPPQHVDLNLPKINLDKMSKDDPWIQNQKTDLPKLKKIEA